MGKKKPAKGDQPATDGSASLPPKTPAGWLLTAADRIPPIKYAIGVVGLVAAAAISIGFFLGHWNYALFGGIAVFVGMVLVRLYASSVPASVRINPSLPVQVILWACVIAFIACLAMGVVTLGLTLFASSQHGGNQETASKKQSARETATKSSSPGKPTLEVASLSFAKYENCCFPYLLVGLKNVGNETAVVRAATFKVRKTWIMLPFKTVKSSTVPPKIKYTVDLNPAAKPYKRSLKVMEAVKPNEVCRFEIEIFATIFGAPKVWEGGGPGAPDPIFYFTMEFVYDDQSHALETDPLLCVAKGDMSIYFPKESGLDKKVFFDKYVKPHQAYVDHNQQILAEIGPIQAIRNESLEILQKDLPAMFAEL